MKYEINRAIEAEKVVNWNTKNPVGTAVHWYSSDGAIKQLSAETTGYAKLDDNGKSYVECRITGILELKNHGLFLDQLKPIGEE